LGIGGLRSARRDVIVGFTFLHIPSHSNLWTPGPGEITFRPKCSKGRRTYQAVMTKEAEPVRVFVVVLIGLVVVLAVLIEVCLLQAASMRRKVKAVLPPPEDGEEEDR
jgi:hypothetical protein